MMQDPSNPIGFLQEFVQKHNDSKLPEYTELSSSGPDHSKLFSCKCSFVGNETIGRANQKKLAKFESAKKMVQLLNENKYFQQIDANLVYNTATTGEQSMASEHLTSSDSTKNPISALQEYCQGRRLTMPKYGESKVLGNFIVSCTIDSNETFAQSSSKKSAKTEAAAKMCIKLHIAFNGDILVKRELEKDEGYCGEKNAISALQEHCAQNRQLPSPVYENKDDCMNSFVVVCHVGCISGEGKDTTKKGAKMLAASIVFGKLMKTIQSNGKYLVPETGSSTSSELGSVSTELSINTRKIKDEKTTTVPRVKYELDEFDTCSSADEEDVNDVTVNSMKSLTLEDSTVEIEETSNGVKLPKTECQDG